MAPGCRCVNKSKTIQRFTCACERMLQSSRCLFELYMLPYGRVLRREISLAGIEEGDVVLNVGCGPSPFTAVLITRLSGARVVAIDQDPGAVEAANALLKGIGMDHQVEALHCDGMAPLPFHYDKAVLALHVEPKGEVLENVIRDRPGVKAVVRVPRAGLKDSYGFGAMPLRSTGETGHLMPTFDRSLLYSA